MVLATVAIIVAACTGGGLRTEVRGSGVLATETRPVTGFDRILVSGFGSVHVEITGTESLRVEAEDNIVDLLTIEVVNGRLELGHRMSQLTPMPAGGARIVLNSGPDEDPVPGRTPPARCDQWH